MSHRTAFAISVALALLFALGVLVGRDRLFAAGDATAARSDPPATAGIAVGGDGLTLPTPDASSVPPRVVEIPLSDAIGAQSTWTDDDDDHGRDRSFGDADDHRHDEEDDHDGEHDDD